MRKQERIGIPVPFKKSVIYKQSVIFNDHRLGLPRVSAIEISQVGDKIRLIEALAIGQVSG